MKSAKSSASPRSKTSCPTVAWSKGPSPAPARSRACAAPSWATPTCVGTFGEAAVIAKRDHFRIRPLAQQLEARMEGNKFKANTVVAIKLARAVYFMLKNKTVFEPERLVAALARN